MAKTTREASPRPRSSARLRSREPLEMRFEDPPTGEHADAKPKKSEEKDAETTVLAKSPPKSATPKATPRKTTVASARSKPAKTLAKTVNEKDIAKPMGLSPPAESGAADHRPVGSKRSLSVTPFETAPISKRQKRKSAVPQKKASTVSAARVMKKPEPVMLTRPLPMAAMALTAVGGVLTAWFYLGIKGLPKLAQSSVIMPDAILLICVVLGYAVVWSFADKCGSVAKCPQRVQPFANWAILEEELEELFKGLSDGRSRNDKAVLERLNVLADRFASDA
ncbi:hypothetical protein FOZ62_031767, partial [Perkinsus olseni]